MAISEDAREAVYELIRDTAKELNNPQSHTAANRSAGALALAEAWAWVHYPNNSHGGGSTQS